jgi:hypothetical protein
MEPEEIYNMLTWRTINEISEKDIREICAESSPQTVETVVIWLQNEIGDEKTLTSYLGSALRAAIKRDSLEIIDIIISHHKKYNFEDIIGTLYKYERYEIMRHFDRIFDNFTFAILDYAMQLDREKTKKIWKILKK